ncbi:hypothetical protein SAMN04488546_1468 [Geodermatophilus poikilotrophus]|uniref:Uncharacterized protein n=2 Tax=Geodermatophilus poikilotrophus TaxID=1333667 RepID=A0A1I0BVU7_9ACTN|nr:hypothetical protein SAMN04488546_1468 [Geodermatophilus poikilotrophus]
MAATVVLGLLAIMVGLLPWPQPLLVPGTTWLVDDVPGPLWVLVLSTAPLCLGTAVVLLRRETGLSARSPVFWAWLAVVVVAAAALVWNALYASALSDRVFGAIIPIFHWLFTFTPAVLAGLLFGGRGRRAGWAAGLGTGVVTLPLFALSWALLAGPEEFSLAGIAGLLSITGILGVAPLFAGVALAGAMGGAARIPR